MKLNKFFILISLLLVLFVSMGMVSATEDIKSDIVFEDIGNVVLNDLSVDDEEIVNLESTEYPVSLSSLARLIREAEPGSTINLPKDFKADGAPANLLIDKSLTIDGQGHTIDGDNRMHIFSVDLSRHIKVVIKNINFVNCTNSSGGAAIYAWGSYGGLTGFQIINCNFTNCHVNSKEGAAIYLSNTADFTIKNCNFVDCFNKEISSRNGQSILVYKSRKGSISDCSFIIHRRHYVVVAVSDENGKAGGFSLNNCKFVNCTPPKGAGVLPITPDSTNKQSINNNVNTSVGNMKNCGNPLVALLIALISLPILRRRK